MPPQIHADQAEHGAGRPPASLSRRSLLRGAAGVGAVSVAAAAGAGTIFAAAGSANAATGAHADTAAHPAGDEPIVAYLRDASTGEFEVFHGTRQVRVRDRKLALLLLNQVR
jgi:hypothetical protein